MKTRLFTPGPLTTDRRVRATMLRDWGSRDEAFIALTTELRSQLLAVAGGEGTHVAVPLQGSGTFGLEAVVATLVGAEHKLLVLVNGAYGRRMVTIAQRMGRSVTALEWPEDCAVEPARVAAALATDTGITHVVLVHCETTTGILNPLGGVAAVVAVAGRVLLLDAMSSFGALPIDLGAMPIGAVIASSNKCLEGVPGIVFALIERGLIAAAAGRSPSVSFDLFEQHRGFERDGQWRFTPPVQVVAATVEALRLLREEGGPAARLARYRRHFEMVAGALTKLGYTLYLEPSVQAPIIATFRPPPGGAFDFAAVYGRLAARGLLIYPGKLTQGESFRIGCIGALEESDFTELVAAFAEAATI
jgi:2-aminoethylphosphonate-pyruvate transaminase